jgi:hypothetical protein
MSLTRKSGRGRLPVPALSMSRSCKWAPGAGRALSWPDSIGWSRGHSGEGGSPPVDHARPTRGPSTRRGQTVERRVWAAPAAIAKKSQTQVSGLPLGTRPRLVLASAAWPEQSGGRNQPCRRTEKSTLSEDERTRSTPSWRGRQSRVSRLRLVLKPTRSSRRPDNPSGGESIAAAA